MDSIEELPKERTSGDEPAYPHLNHNDKTGEPNGQHHGLTKREAFAMAAMQGLCSNAYYSERQRDIAMKTEGDYLIDPILCERAIQIADELLKQLEHGSK